MRINCAIGVMIFIWATTASAQIIIGTSEDFWAQHSEVVVVGHVAEVNAIEVRPTRGREREYNPSLFPHGAARIVVSDILKNTSECKLAVGDTVSAIFLTDNHGHPARQSEGIVTTSVLCDYPRPKVFVDESGAFVIQPYSGEWFLSREVLDADKMRDAVKRFAEQMDNLDASGPR